MANASIEMGPPTSGEAAAALMTALKGSMQDLERALNRGGLKRIKELVAECRHDAEALQGLRAELDGATVDSCLEELREYEEKAIGVAKKYYDESINTVEALLGTWGPSGPPVTSENSKTPRGEAHRARPGGPPTRGRGRGRVGGSSFQPAPPPGHPDDPSPAGGGRSGE